MRNTAISSDYRRDVLKKGRYYRAPTTSYFHHQLSIRRSIFYRLARDGSPWQQVKPCSAYNVPINVFQLLPVDPEALKWQVRYIFSPAGSGSTSGSPTSWTCPENLHWKAPGRHPDQTPVPPQLTSIDVKDQRLYSELPLDVWAPYLISKAKPSQFTEETNFGSLHPRSRSFGHCPKLMTIGEGWKVNWLVMALSFGSAPSAPQWSGTVPALLLPLHQSTCQTHALYYPRPKTWPPPLEAAACSQPEGSIPPFADGERWPLTWRCWLSVIWWFAID